MNLDSLDIDEMDEDELRMELTDALAENREYEHLVIEWKTALIAIGRAAHKGELDVIKGLVEEALK